MTKKSDCPQLGGQWGKFIMRGNAKELPSMDQCKVIDVTEAVELKLVQHTFWLIVVRVPDTVFSTTKAQSDKCLFLCV